MNYEHEKAINERTLAILRHAVDTQDLNLATHALNVRMTVIKACDRLARMSDAYMWETAK